MKNKAKVILWTILCFPILAFSSLVVVAATIDDSPDATDIVEINQATPGTAKVSLGTRLCGLLQKGVDTSAASEFLVGPITYTATTAVMNKTTGVVGGESIALANGYSNQEFTVVLSTDGGRDFIITPTTKTGFSKVTLGDANDTITLRYVDDTVGWVISGNNASTVN